MSQTKAEKKEMNKKLNQQYIETKINPIIEPMTHALFSELETSPNEDPIEFMLKHLAKDYGNRPSALEAERMELEFLREEVPNLQKVHGIQNKIYGKMRSYLGENLTAGHNNDGNQSSSSSEDEQEDVGELPPMNS